jgi:hypothetical protein
MRPGLSSVSRRARFNSTCNGVADPDDGAEQDNGEHELKSGNHESSPCFSLYRQ